MYSELSELASLKGITIGHINIRSIYRKLEEIIRILSVSNLDVLCITESWLNRFVPDYMLSIDGYNILRADRTAESGKTTSGGIIVYYKNSLNVTLLADYTTCTPNGETVWLNLQLKQTRPQYIGVVYRPPDGDYNIPTNTLQEHLTSLNTRNCDRMLIGDINVDLF